MEAVKTSQNLVHMRQTSVRGIEEERVIIAADCPVEGGKALRSEFVVGSRFEYRLQGTSAVAVCTSNTAYLQ